MGITHCLSSKEFSQPLAATCPRDVLSQQRPQATKEKENNRAEVLVS